MSLRSNGSYIGPRPTGPTDGIGGVASGIWDVRTAQRQRAAAAWPFRFENPTQITGLQLWLDASDASTLYDATSGGSLVAADGGVARWEDKSGNARHFTQSTAGSRPTRKTNQQNGRDTLLFDGSDDFLDGSDFMDANTGGLTAFVVVKRNATGSFHEIMTKATTSGAGWFVRFSNTNKLQGNLDLGNGTDAVRATSSAVSASGYTAITWKFSAGSFLTQEFYRNGVAESMASATGAAQTPPNNSGIVRVGAQEYLGGFYNYISANIAEIIMYNSALSGTDREAVENYLLAKWAIT